MSVDFLVNSLIQFLLLDTITGIIVINTMTTPMTRIPSVEPITDTPSEMSVGVI